VTSQKPGGPPRLDLSSRSPLDLAPAAPSAGPYFHEPSARPIHRTPPSDTFSPVGRERDAPENRPPVPSKNSLRRNNPGPPAQSPNTTAEDPIADLATRNFIAALEEERRKYGEHTAMGYSGSKAKKTNKPRAAGLHVEVPVTSGAPPPQVGMFSDTSAAVASAGTSAHRGRRGSVDSGEEAPVMQATSYPGQEWMPEFYYD
jgi:hypothetical protein